MDSLLSDFPSNDNATLPIPNKSLELNELHVEVEEDDSTISASEMCRRMMDVAPKLSPLQDTKFGLGEFLSVREELFGEGMLIVDIKSKIENLKLGKKTEHKPKQHKKKVDKKKPKKANKVKNDKKNQQWKPLDSNRFDRQESEPKLCKKKRHK